MASKTTPPLKAPHADLFEPTGGLLPELAAVYWRRRVDEQSLTRAGAIWTAWTMAHTVPFLGIAVLLMLLSPLAFPVAAISLVQAWIIPELYAQRGANVLRPRPAGGSGARLHDPERVALGLLGDLVGHRPRELHRLTGIVLEHGRLGCWLVGEAGALLVRPGGHRVHCYCVRVPEPGLPPSDRIAHLLLALRADEQGFATIANLAFSGAPWRIRRRLAPGLRPALAMGVADARA